MPIYILECPKCLINTEEILGMDEANPQHCGVTMVKKITSPAVTRMGGKAPPRSKGYKEGYSKEYIKSIESPA